jgi:hypothetical protein
MQFKNATTNPFVAHCALRRDHKKRFRRFRKFGKFEVKEKGEGEQERIPSSLFPVP